jgi:hypothetical protein
MPADGLRPTTPGDATTGPPALYYVAAPVLNKRGAIAWQEHHEMPDGSDFGVPAGGRRVLDSGAPGAITVAARDCILMALVRRAPLGIAPRDANTPSLLIELAAPWLLIMVSRVRPAASSRAAEQHDF